MHKWVQEFESAFLQRRIRKLSVPSANPEKRRDEIECERGDDQDARDDETRRRDTAR
jgi:hypothetical protein